MKTILLPTALCVWVEQSETRWRTLGTGEMVAGKEQR